MCVCKPVSVCSLCGGHMPTNPLLHNVAAIYNVYYAFCPNCGREIPPECQTLEWKARWQKRVAELTLEHCPSREEIELLAFAINEPADRLDPALWPDPKD